MRNTFLFIVMLVGVLYCAGCLPDNKNSNPAAENALADDAAGNGKAKQAWRDKVKANQGKNASSSGAGGRNNIVGNSPQSKLLAKFKKPVTTDKNKGVFISEAQQYLKLTPAKTQELDKLIERYKRKGLDFKFFGGFYSNKKPFAKDLAKIFTPLQIEMFKHFHAYWFDRIPYPRPDMPVSLYYHLNLSKDQFIKIIGIYSSTTIAKGRKTPDAIAKGEKEITAILNPGQKKIYREILAGSNEKF